MPDEMDEMPEVSPAELEDGARSAHELGNRALLLLLDSIGPYDARELWSADGCRSGIEWVCMSFNVSKSTAAAWLRAAHALPGLPECRKAFSEGLLSWDQLRWLVELATPDTDHSWADAAPGMSPKTLRRAARRKGRIDKTEAERARRQRFCRAYWDPFTDMLRIFAQLPAAEGAVVYKALERATDRQPKTEESLSAAQRAEAVEANQSPDPDDQTLTCEASGDEFEEPRAKVYRLYAHRSADALVEICSSYLASDPEKDRATVVVHLDQQALMGQANGIAEQGLAIPPDTVRRLTCDARVQTAIHDSSGQVVGIGRASRNVPAWLWRLVLDRDGGCTFPGCGDTKFLQCHHTIHWFDGGPTDLDHLTAQCFYHHDLVHHHGWRIEGLAPDLAFISPDGRIYHSRAGPRAA